MQVWNNIKSLASLNKYLWRYRKQLLWGMLFVIISNFFGVIPAQVLRYALDLVAQNISYYKLSEGFAAHGFIVSRFSLSLVLYAVIILCMALLRGVFMYMMRQTIIVMSRKIEYDLKNDMYKHLQDLSMSYYRSNNTGDLMARMSEDVGRVRMYLGPAIMYSINLVTLVVLVVSIMLAVNVKLTFFVMLPLPILAIAIYYVNNITYKRGTMLQEQLSSITTFVQETFSGIRVIKSFASEKSVEKHFESEVQLYMNKSLYLARVDAFFFPVILLLIGTSTLITLYVGGQEVMKGTMSPGNIAEFFLYVNSLAWPVASIGWTTNLIQRAAASQKRINEIMNVQAEITWKGNPVLIPQGDIEFRNVNFNFHGTGQSAMDKVNFHIRPGESLGVIGHTGSGKSTLAHLTLRSYDVSSGEILIDGKNITQIDLGAYREHIGYVPQDDFLFSESIAHNILFSYKNRSREGKPTDEEQKLLEWAANIADVKNDIEGFPLGYETILGERGITLSGGQKQRVAIARAIISNPKILILDDCFSAIDTNTEARILQNLGSVMRGKSSIIISHRVSTVKNCNRIIVLSAGKIIEEGKHEDLLAKEGYYFNLYRKQLMEKELYERQKLELD